MAGGACRRRQAGGSIDEQWMQASEALLREICAQCQAAATVGGGGGSADAMPIKLHPDAEVACRYDFKLPENAPGKFAQFEARCRSKSTTSASQNPPNR